MSIKLTYFNLCGLGEVIRYLLKYGGIDFEDIRVSFEEWHNMKSTTPFGQLPVYEEHGKTAYQSTAIARYLAKKIKLAGMNDWEDLELDALVDTINDLRQKVFQLRIESDPVQKDQLKSSLMKETIPFYMDRFERRAEQNFGFLAFGRLTWADFFFTTAIDLMISVTEENLLENRPNLQSVRNNVVDLPVIKEWNETRPKTTH